ncbi:DUF438 domain-containing protein [Granulicatella adiacens ATCC 49175]|jgi:sensory box protein|uniref:Hemerythrin HHE cation binding domain protein n=1 Tax=Granulicatella adiacens ATCC 49175 TaxID=638301 RepID=C8NEK4_9LACT|nr:DUF438 domain-containing protein [Granulicatella adiacens]EEW38105.1 hemerythrin HHE cation binding domain protein [Granulicatella adiacens ATCC 49175]UWP38999.1 DUF438 domain-containing protein [Granulicatella adiacens ATCC 49175]
MAKEDYTMEERQEILKNLMLRLHAGEDKEVIQEEFNEVFDEISPYEIQLMERNLMSEGITFAEIMSLCNVHANLMGSKVNTQTSVADFEQPGHPVHVMKMENLAIRGALDRVERLLVNYLETKDSTIEKGLRRQISLLDQFENHYQRKEYAMFPIMEKKGITAPPKVMWGVHDQIRDLYRDFKKALNDGKESTLEEFQIARDEMLEMIQKEENILIPMVEQVFHVDDWETIASQSPDYGYCIVKPEKEWAVKKSFSPVKEETQVESEGDIPLSTGSLSLKELNLILNLLPMELSFVDAQNIVKYYNEGNGEEKIFKRTPSAIGRDVILCHPPRVHETVQTIFEQLKSKQKEKEEMWFKTQDKMVHVTYHAVWDEEGKYRGCLEYVQDIKPLVKHFEEADIKRTLS